MSGDVQPRKRKDKKRRKDDASEEKTTHAQHSYVPLSSTVDDVNIHVHHEGGTGGGICAKIIFFLLFSALAVLVGLIIIEHRGLTELDTVNTESRFSQIFEGWVDNGHGHEDDHSNEILDAIDDDHDDDDDDHDDGHDDEELDDEEEEDDHDDEDEEHEEEPVEQEEEEEDEDEEEEQPVSDEVNDEEDEEEEETTQEYDQVEQSEEQNEDETQEEDEETLEEAESEEQQPEQEEDEVEEDVSKAASEEEAVNEEPEASEEKNDEDEANGDEEIVASSENKETVKEEAKEVDDADDGEVNEENAENSNMAVKLGVGVALLIVAHVVLIRKWKSASNETTTNNNNTTTEQQQPSDLSRRNTIVVPPSLEEIAQDLEEYSEGDDEIESDAEQYEPQSVKTKYQELRTTYVRSLTPDFESKTKGTEADDEDEEIEEEEIDEEVEEEDEEEEDGDDEVDEEEEEYVESDNEEEYNDDEDEDLLQRLEAKYGKIQDEEQLSSWKRVNVPSNDNEAEESEPEKQSDDEDGYEHADITNKDDFNIKEQIDDAQKSIEKNSALAIKQFNAILNKYPSSPRSIYGKALALDNLADQKKSNEILRQALKVYLQLLQLDRKLVPDALFVQAGEKCINRMRFLGLYSNVEYVHKLLIDRFPNEPKYQNDLAVSYLTINRVEKARQILKNILSKWTNNGVALVHYGFILKTTDNNLNESIIYLKKGMSTGEAGVHDGRFYFHLGDALTRLGRKEEAFHVYEEGVKNNVFLSKYQRSLYNVNHLTGKAWWSEQDLPYKNLFNLLKNNYELIREEGLSVLNEKGYFQDESENLRDTGDWKQFELFARGQKNFENCKRTPFTCKIIQSMSEASGCKRGQTKFSVMHGGTHVWPHCGPTNCRLRIHLGLKVPENTYIRVAEETRSWEEGKLIIFDDSFEHEVWHNGTSLRLVLIVDVWHPELNDQEKRSLSPI